MGFLKKLLKIISTILFVFALALGASYIFVKLHPPAIVDKTNHATADLRNACTAQEAYYYNNQTYTNSINHLTDKKYGLTISPGIVFQIISADKNHFEMQSYHMEDDFIYYVKGPGGMITRNKKDKHYY